MSASLEKKMSFFLSLSLLPFAHQNNAEIIFHVIRDPKKACNSFSYFPISCGRFSEELFTCNLHGRESNAHETFSHVAVVQGDQIG
jgi:hypothetical protein